MAAAFLVVALVSIRQDRRRFRNAVLLGLAVACLILALLGDIDRLPPETAAVVVFFVLLAPLFAVFVLAVFLLANGITMIRRESRSLGNLLSFLAGLGLLTLVVLLITAQYTQHPAIGAVAVSALAAVSYLSFLFCCYLGYAFLYSRLRARPGVDFVIVLGSRIIDGRIPPLLASRLDKAITLYRNERDRGGDPFVIASGGQGPDETQPEAHAMADYLLAHGVPADKLLREDRSTTTAQNLTLSRELMQHHRPGYRCVVVTNNFHAFRAAILARTAKVNGQVVGAPTALYYWPSATIREFAAVIMEHRLVNLSVTGLLAVTGFLAALP
ncbi:YdcF family protein [Amycolatopsis sp. NPDC004625]|uniref:YdcF family protein n=1 Tax=Amycolatopsis sp. NPDC004625 TaxID=3154670 RepID=UPI0033A2AC5C